MTAAEALRLINEIERAVPVGDWTIGGVRVWPLARAEIWWAVNTDYADVRAEVKSERLVARRLRQLLAQPLAMSRWAVQQVTRPADRASLRGQAAVVVLGDSVSRVCAGGRWIDRHTDPLVDVVEGLGESAVQLDPYYLRQHPLQRPAARIQPRLDLLWLRSRFGGPPDAVALPGHDQVLARLEAAGVRVPAIAVPALQRQVSFITLVARWFETVLARTGARLGIVVDQAPVQMAFNLACARRGIPSVEVQHGVQNENVRYRSWENVPAAGYELGPSHYWCWSEQDVRGIEAWSSGLARHEPLLGGNLWLQAWIDGAEPAAAASDQAIGEERARHPGTLDVLVTLSRGFTSEVQLAPLRAAIASTAGAWRWWIRPHPAMETAEAERVVASLAPGAAQAAINAVAARVPLYGLLRRVDVHVTHVSSSVIEARAFGVPSVALDPTALALYPDEAREGWVVGAADAHELEARIAAQAQAALPADGSARPVAAATLIARLLDSGRLQSALA